MINWAYSDIQDDDIKDGYYKAVIHSAELKQSQAGNEMLVLAFRVEGSTFIPRKFQLTEPTKGYPLARVKSDLAKLAACFSIKEGADSPSDFIGAKGFIKISHRERKNHPGVLDIVISFPPPDEGKNSYAKQAQQLAAEKFAQSAADISAWNPDEAF